jgi:hypothetical protein
MRALVISLSLHINLETKVHFLNVDFLKNVAAMDPCMSIAILTWQSFVACSTCRGKMGKCQKPILFVHAYTALLLPCSWFLGESHAIHSHMLYGGYGCQWGVLLMQRRFEPKIWATSLTPTYVMKQIFHASIKCIIKSKNLCMYNKKLPLALYTSGGL